MDFNEIFIFLALCMSLRIFKWSRKIKNLHEITNIFSRARLCTHMAALCMFSWKIVWVSLLCELKSNFHDHSLSLLTSSYSFIRARLTHITHYDDNGLHSRRAIYSRFNVSSYHYHHHHLYFCCTHSVLIYSFVCLLMPIHATTAGIP